MSLQIFVILVLAISLFLPGKAPASDVPVRLNLYSEGGVLTKEVKSMKEMRQRQMVPQSRDFSCGAAALATVMRYYYGQPMTELDAILGMFKHGDQQDIKKRGFSLLDMKRYANSLEYKAGGFKVTDLDVLKKLTVPVIVLIETGNYKHFVVLRRADDQYVYLSDPSWGNRRLSLEEFSRVWKPKVIFAVQGPRVGTPEGLYVEHPALAQEVSTMLVQDSAMRVVFALDPADSMLFVTNTPLFIVPFIPGQ